MHRRFDHKAIEQKWQADWKKSNLYATTENPDKPKAFILDMFPYPSGEGLHVGHPKGYIATDIYSRFKRMTGHEVLHPMGWDAFGLPAENYAIKNKVHPRKAVEENVMQFKKQLEVLGMDYDWDREINTTDPEFYKWTQWIFIQLFKKGLAYESHEPINWCPGCQTGLANEDLEADGTCERCDSVVEKRPMRQWVLNIRAYADRMIEDLDTLQWPEHIKEAQRNWIGRSQGAQIAFKLNCWTSDVQQSEVGVVEVFTTRPDTLFGATYMVLAPEHELVLKMREHLSNQTDVETYIAQTLNKKEMDRLDDTKEKTGVKLEGITATNPASGEEIPVYIADYVLAGYGTGAIMAVPAHDERDFEFASKFGVEIRQVIAQHFDLGIKEGVEVLERGDVVDLLIEHPTDGTFLLQREKSGVGDQVHFVGGGTDGESHEIAIGRELLEETGFTDYKILSSPVDVSTCIAYRHTKNKNQRTKSHFYHIKLNSLEQQKSEIDEGKHTIEWVAKDDLEELMNWDGHLAAWGKFLGTSIYSGTGSLVNSGEFDGMDSETTKQAIVEKVNGRMTNTYKIRDWVFSRQRYWGEPIPIVHCEKCGPVTVPEDQLPVTLPEVKNYEPAGDGQSPLSTITDWVNTTCPVCGGEGKRETNTMPQWAGSSWYYLRYMDPKNTDALVSKENEKYWAPVDVYVGGDHAVRHLIYARFWHKFLYDINVVSTLEPFQRLEFLGFILAEDGRKMSKRWGNVINPNDIVDLVGADTLRVYEMFMGPFENTIAWNQDGLAGARRFLERVYGLAEHIVDNEPKETTAQLHKTIKKVSQDIEQFKFNTAVSSMMIFINQAEKGGLQLASYDAFLRLLAPFAPHITEELWRDSGNADSVHLAAFPAYNAELAKDQTVTIGVQINGKVRGDITIAPDASQEQAMVAVQENPNLKEKVTVDNITKIIYVPGRILNILQT